MKLQHILMGAGLVVGIWLAFFADNTPETPVAQALVRSTTSGTSAGKASNGPDNLTAAAVPRKKNVSGNERVMSILALSPRQKLISVGHVGLDGKKQAGNGTIFGAQNWAPLPPVVDPRQVAAQLPTAPPLKFTFVGEKLEDGVWEVFLTQGDTLYTVHNQSVINGIYRVDAITTAAVMLTYLPLNQVQRLNIKGTR